MDMSSIILIATIFAIYQPSVYGIIAFARRSSFIPEIAEPMNNVPPTGGASSPTPKLVCT